MSDIIIRIKDDTTVVLEEHTDGIIKQKNINLSDLAECISDSISGGVLSSGLLPQNCLSYGYNTDTGSHYVVLEYPEKSANVTYMKTLYKDLSIPKLVFGFVIIGQEIQKVNIGVVANKKLTEKTKMYIYPFSNVSEFYLCTGSNALPKIKNFTGLTNLARFILELPDNDDHYNSEKNQLALGHRDLLEHMTDKSTEYYYKKILLPMQRKTLSDFIKAV